MFTIRPDLTKKNILKRITTLDIFKRYCENFKKPGVKFRERNDDSQPSCLISLWNGDYLYKDFGMPGSYRAIDYVAYKHNESFHEALKRINEDFQLGLGNDLDSSIKPKSVLSPKSNLLTSADGLRKVPSVIKVKRRGVVACDIDFWESYGWTADLLELARIHPITHFWITNPRKGVFNHRTKVSDDKLVYTFDYYSHQDVFRRKLYFPGEDPKFLSNVDYTVVQGYPALPRFGDILIITSSLKDCGPFWRLGYPAIAPNSETEFFYESYVEKLKSRFKRMVIWFDNDGPGIKNAKSFASYYNIEFIYNPPGTPKDPSDFVYHKGIEEFSQLVSSLLTQTNKIFK